MQVRAWTARAIEEKGTVSWFIGMTVKSSMEILFALVFGLATALFVVRLFPIRALQGYLGTATQPTIWLMTSAGLFWKLTFCKYTEPLIDQ